MKVVTTACFLLISPVLLAEVPVIKSVVNLGSQDARFSPGVLAEVRYVAPSFRIESDKVRVGDRTVDVVDEDDGQGLIIRLPTDLPIGASTVVLETSAGTSKPFPIVVHAYSPAIYPPSPSPFFNSGLPSFACNHTAVTGDILNVFAIGLGTPDAQGAVAKPSITVGGRMVDVTEFAPITVPGIGSLGSGAAYRLQFVVPPGDGMHSIVVTAGGQKSNAVSLPVGKAILSLSAPSFSARLIAAPESIITAYQCSNEDFVRRPDVVWATPPDLPTSLAGVSMSVKDSAGVVRLAPMYAVNHNQVNYVLPAGTAPGLAAATVLSDGRVIGEADLQVEPVAPDLFQNVQVVRFRDGVQTTEQVSQIDMGPETDQVYVVMYGTGVRFRTALANVTATIDGVDVRVEYAGPQGGGLPGLDQVNMHLPRSLAGRGAVALFVTVDGRPASAQLFFK